MHPFSLMRHDLFVQRRSLLMCGENFILTSEFAMMQVEARQMREIPQDIVVESLSDYRMGELRRLKGWLYQQRVKIRQERERGERGEQREAKARQEAKQKADE